MRLNEFPWSANSIRDFQLISPGLGSILRSFLGLIISNKYNYKIESFSL